MTVPAIIFMIIICSLVWGGFVTFISIVWKIEKRKARSREL
jgi:hypothetical protein